MLDFQNVQLGYSPQKLWTFVQNYTFEKGNIYALIGRNGAGKSTFLRTLAKQLPLLDGQILLEQKNLTQYNFPDLARQIAVVRTDKIHLPYTTIREILAYGRMPYTNHWGILGKGDWLFVDKILSFLHLENLAHKQFNACSDGEQQLALFGRALVQDTPIVLLDEITSHLDFINRELVFQYLHQIAKQENKIIFIATHELPLALKYSDSILLFSKQRQISLFKKENLDLPKIFELW